MQGRPRPVLTTTILIMTTCGLIVASTTVWLIWLERRRNSDDPRIKLLSSRADAPEGDAPKGGRI